jgi:hypothetical protein
MVLSQYRDRESFFYGGFCSKKGLYEGVKVYYAAEVPLYF